MKKIIAVLMLVSLIAVFFAGTFAFGESAQQQFVVDKFNAFGTVGESELQRLNTLANEIYKKYDYAGNDQEHTEGEARYCMIKLKRNP